MAVGHADFGEVASTTLNEHASMLANNIFENQPYMVFINQAGRVKDFAGGQQIVEPSIYAGNSTFSSYAGYDTLDVTAQTGITAATFAPKQAYATIAIDGYTQIPQDGHHDFCGESVRGAVEQVIIQFDIHLAKRLAQSCVNAAHCPEITPFRGFFDHIVLLRDRHF